MYAASPVGRPVSQAAVQRKSDKTQFPVSIGRTNDHE